MPKLYYNRTTDVVALGPVMHAIQDASIPHHTSGYNGNWHGSYEAKIDSRIDTWFQDQSFVSGIKTLYNSWNHTDANVPTSLTVSDWNKTPASNWRIDFLVTWLALNAYHSYSTTYNHFRNGFSFNEADAKELTKKATAICMLVLNNLSTIDILEDCILFDYTGASVQKIGNRWKIVVGNMWLLDFEDKETEARQAVSIIQHYKMNSQCFVGRPNPSMEYYKCNGTAPVGSFPGEDAIPFNPSNLEVRLIQLNQFSSWKIVEGNHYILDFGLKENEARKALSIIKKYGFTHICFVGRPNPSMTYFRR